MKSAAIGSTGLHLMLLLAGVLFPRHLAAQQPASASSGSGLPPTVTAFGSVRTRLESWDWFDAGTSGAYTYSGSTVRAGLGGSRSRYNWQVELAAPILLGLPTDAVLPNPQGQLGFGAAYFAANSGRRNTSLPFLKQAFVRFRGSRGTAQESLTIGRMDFTEGTETTDADTTLAALKRDRIQQRLIGNFGFTHVGRSFDGVQYALDWPGMNLTVFAARPTRGVFQVDGWGDLNVNVFYGALTKDISRSKGAAEWRVFAIGYNDYRDGVLKTDNRPLTARQTDRNRINLATVGGHYIETIKSGSGSVDLLFWGALQGGSWGALAQRSGAVAIEAGFQPSIWRPIRPWFRAGWNYASGDGNPNDGVHGTFFQLLPTPRGYARFPFFNMMNSSDVFGEAILRPARRVTIHTDIHSLRLANRNDLWYVGGGAFQPWTFGYTGRPSGGQSGLVTLYDVSVDYGLSDHLSMSFYWAHARGKAVVKNIYSGDGRANLGFVELDYRF